MELVLCLSCGFLIKDTDTIDVYKCPECNNVMNKEKYDCLFQKTNDAMENSYRYRIAYEDVLKAKFGHVDVKNEDVNFGVQFSLLPISTILNFIGMAALTGIIGGASFEVTRHITKKLLIQLRNSKLTQEEIDLICDEEKFNKLVECLSDFNNEYENLPEHLKTKLTELESGQKILNLMNDENSESLSSVYNEFDDFWGAI